MSCWLVTQDAGAACSAKAAAALLNKHINAVRKFAMEFAFTHATMPMNEPKPNLSCHST